MFNVGRLCMKIAGRDAGKRCVVLEVDNGTVLVDGETRRRKVSVKHLEPLNKTIEIAQSASHADVKSALKKLDITVLNTKPKKKATRPKKIRKVKIKTVKKKALPKIEEKNTETKKDEKQTPVKKEVTKTEESKKDVVKKQP